MEWSKKYRPKTFEKVIGCKETAMALKSKLDEGTLQHAILITGPSGCGKTTLARLIKDRIGCSEMDFQEINCADTKGIDTIRNIRYAMFLSPAGGPVRMWLMDECHLLTSAAQSALLKITEDTPPHVYFVFATTDPQKLIPTLRSRFTPHQVRLLYDEEAKGLLNEVAKKEGVNLSTKTIDKLIESAQGSARVLLVLLEKIASIPEEDREKVTEDAIRAMNESIDICKAMMERPPQWKKVAKILQNLKEEPESVRRAILGFARYVLLRDGTWESYNVIRSLDRNLFDSGAAGLAAGCYEACNSKK